MGLPLEVGTIEKGDLTIENILEEKKIFDLNVRFERFGVADGDRSWSLPGRYKSLFLSWVTIYVARISGPVPILDLLHLLKASRSATLSSRCLH